MFAAVNPEEIELGDDDDDEDGGEEEAAADATEVQEKAVPAAVFGSLAQQAQDQQGEQLGALDRFKKRRVE